MCFCLSIWELESLIHVSLILQLESYRSFFFPQINYKEVGKKKKKTRALHSAIFKTKESSYLVKKNNNKKTVLVSGDGKSELAQ